MPQGASASSATAIVVLGLYTDDLVELRGSVSAAETEVTNLFAIANQAHLDSATGVQLKVAARKRGSVDTERANDGVLDRKRDEKGKVGAERGGHRGGRGI